MSYACRHSPSAPGPLAASATLPRDLTASAPSICPSLKTPCKSVPPAFACAGASVWGAPALPNLPFQQSAGRGHIPLGARGPSPGLTQTPGSPMPRLQTWPASPELGQLGRPLSRGLQWSWPVSASLLWSRLASRTRTGSSWNPDWNREAGNLFGRLQCRLSAPWEQS